MAIHPHPIPWGPLGSPGSSWVRGGTASSWWSSAGQEHCSWRPNCISSRSIASVVHGPLASRNASKRAVESKMVLKWCSPPPQIRWYFRLVLISEIFWVIYFDVGSKMILFMLFRGSKSEPQEISGEWLQLSSIDWCRLAVRFLRIFSISSIYIDLLVSLFFLGVVHAGKQSIVGYIWCHQYPCILAAFGFVWWRVHPRISICMCCMFYSKRPIPLISDNRLATCACPIF